MTRSVVMTTLVRLLLLTSESMTASTFADSPVTTIEVTVDRGADLGQCFGSLFEARTKNGELVFGAGFSNGFNTRYRADRHAIHFYLRPADGKRTMKVEELPRPTTNLTGSYLFERDGTVFSTYGGLKAWDAKAGKWLSRAGRGGTDETMRVGDGTLSFGASVVRWNGQVVLAAPPQGRYELFFYANGHLCFYHIHRRGMPYRVYKNDEDGFSRLYAVPWKPSEGMVDLSKATVLRLPVVGETTFAWGQIRDQIITGSNVGGFYVFENGRWKMLLEPDMKTSYQLYSTLGYHDELLMGQYPTGRVFRYDGKKIHDQKGWPPVLPGVSGSAREAQTTTIYGGDVMVGVWPWAEVWRYNPDGRKWFFMKRMFDHPELSAKITHPYDLENKDNSPRNQWGQRVTSLVPHGSDLFIATSAKAPYRWKPAPFPFLTPDKWKSYGKVYKATMEGQLAASTRWTNGATQFRFTAGGGFMTIHQDGELLARTPLDGRLGRRLATVGPIKSVTWGNGIYGRHNGRSLKGTVARPGAAGNAK